MAKRKENKVCVSLSLLHRLQGRTNRQKGEKKRSYLRPSPVFASFQFILFFETTKTKMKKKKGEPIFQRSACFLLDGRLWLVPPRPKVVFAPSVYKHFLLHHLCSLSRLLLLLLLQQQHEQPRPLLLIHPPFFHRRRTRTQLGTAAALPFVKTFLFFLSI